MGTSRISNRDVLDAIQNQTETLSQLIAVLTATAQPKAEPVAQPKVETGLPGAKQPKAAEGNTFGVEPKYLAVMTEKAKSYALAKGVTVILYSRRNGKGEVKLAFSQPDRYETIRRQPSHISAIKQFVG